MIMFDSRPACAIVSHQRHDANPSTVAAETRLDLALAKDFATIPSVRHVLTERVADAFLVWVAVDDPEPQIRRSVYAKELEIISAFPEINFDFNLVPSLGRETEEFATAASLVYSRAA